MKNRPQGSLMVAGCACWLMLGTSLTPPLLAQQQPNPREQLQQYVAELRRSPADDALREKIINLAQELKPPPAIPEEARRHYVRADALRSDARSPQDAIAAASEYQQALLEAPWWSEAYRDLGVALEVATRYAEAKKVLSLYLLCHPSEDEARKTQDEIYRIEAKQEKLANEERAEHDAAREHQEQRSGSKTTRSDTVVGSWAFLCRDCASFAAGRGSSCSDTAEFIVANGADGQYTLLWPGHPADSVDQVRITPDSVHFRVLQDPRTFGTRYAFYFDFKLSEHDMLVGTRRYFFRGHEDDDLLSPYVVYCRK